MQNKPARPTSIIFLRARHLGSNGPDRKVEQQMISWQRAACEQVAATLDAQIIREYVEYGGTGSIEQRPTLRLMLDELHALRDTTYVIVTRSDRLMRGHDQTAAITRKIQIAGAGLVIFTFHKWQPCPALLGGV